MLRGKWQQEAPLAGLPPQYRQPPQRLTTGTLTLHLTLSRIGHIQTLQGPSCSAAQKWAVLASRVSPALSCAPVLSCPGSCVADRPPLVRRPGVADLRLDIAAEHGTTAGLPRPSYPAARRASHQGRGARFGENRMRWAFVIEGRPSERHMRSVSCPKGPKLRMPVIALYSCGLADCLDTLVVQGVVHVRESGGQRWRLSMSGRRRLCVDNDGGWGACVPRTQLVLIGKGLDTKALRQALEEACVDPSPRTGEAEAGRRERWVEGGRRGRRETEI